MNAPVTRFEPQTVPCDTCATPFTQKRAWSRFCCTQCRSAFARSEARKEAVRAAAPALYQALATLAAVEGPVGGIALAALKDLKPPESPLALLEKARK